MHDNDHDDDISAELSGQYLKQSDFADGPLAFLISSVEVIHYEAKNGRPEQDKRTLFFTDEHRFGLNKTNLALMAKFYGKHWRVWIGKPITIFWDESVSFAGRLTGGMRLRLPMKQEIEALNVGITTDDIPF